MSLEIYLLGELKLDLDGTPLQLPATVRARSLLAYLVTYRQRSHSRERLAELFWPGRPRARALRSLSTALWHIRRVLPSGDYILSDAHTVQFNPQSDYWLDVEAFEEKMQDARSRMREAESCILPLTSCVQLYRGDFLEGFYDDWCLEVRYRLEGMYLEALERLMTALEALNQPEAALRWGEQLLAHDPLREDVYRAVIQLHVRLGNRAEALHHARRCRAVLRSELGVDPTPETVALCDELLGPAWRRFPDRVAPPPSPLPVAAPSDDPLVRPPFVGRKAEWEVLLRRWEEARSGRGNMVLVSGEAGIGKTRLVEELAQYVRQRGGWTVQAGCYEYEHALPYGPLADLLRGMVAVDREHALRCLSPWQIADLSRLAPDLLAPPPPRDQHALPSESEQSRLFHALVSLLLDLARHNPLLMILEDLQWSHPSVLAWLHYLARRLPDAPLLVVATYRPGEAEPAYAVADLERRLEWEGVAIGLPLPRLSQADLSDWMAGAAPETVADIYHHTEGNPFFVLETQRALLDEGRLRLEGGRWLEAAPSGRLPIPDSVRQAIQMRLRCLSAPAGRALEVAAVIGRSFDFEVLRRAWGKDEETVLEALDELLRCRLVREGGSPFGRDYQFDHHLVREAAYDQLPPHARRRLHRRVAEALVEASGAEPAASAEVAYHYVQAEAWPEAQAHLLRAGDEAGRIAADSEALAYYRQAILAYERAFGERWDPLSRATLERKIGESFFRCGEYAQALVHLQRALGFLGRPLPARRGAVRRELVAALLRQVAHRAIPIRPRRAAALPIPPTVEEEVRIYFSIGWIHALEANYEPYLLVSLRALNRSEGAGYARGTALSAAALGTAADFIPLFRLAGYYHRHAARLVARVDHPGTIGFVYQGLAYHHHLLGEHEAVLEYARRSAEAYRRGDDPHRWALAKLLIAYTYEYGGAFDRALACAQEIVRTGEEVADTWILCVGHEMLGIVQRRQGRLEEACVHLQRAVALAEQVPDHMSLIEGSGELAKCYLRQGRWEEAVALLEARQRVVAEQDVYGDSLGRFLNGLAEVYLVAAEQAPPSSQPEWLARAKRACRDALKQSRAFRAAEPEALRLRGKYEWLRGKPSAAQRWWRRSLARAEALGHPYDLALAHLEMGRCLGQAEHLQRALALLTELGAEWRMRSALP